MDDMTPLPTSPMSPIEAIRLTDTTGDFWVARELMPLYGTWSAFNMVLWTRAHGAGRQGPTLRAMADCAEAGRAVGENSSLDVRISGKRGSRQKEYRRTRCACRVIAMTAQTAGTGPGQ